MRDGVAVGIDVAKDFDWVQVVDRRDSEVVFNGRVDNTPAALAAFVEQLETLRDRGPLKVGVDVVGGIAGLLCAMLAEAGIEVVHVPGRAVNRAREGTGGASTRATRATPRSSPTASATVATCARSSRSANWTPRSGCSSVVVASW